MIPVRQSTAFECSIGPVLDADGVAVTDGVVGDFKLKKTTGNFAALNGSATLTHVSAGTYDLVLTTSDTDTVGLCSVVIDDTTNACAPLYLQVIEEAVYDMLYAASAVGYVANAPVNVAQISGDSTAADALEAAWDGTVGAHAPHGIVDRGTLQSATATTAVLRAGASFGDDVLIGATLHITGGTGVGQRAIITDWVSATDTATVATWTVTPDNTSTYDVFASAAGASLDDIAGQVRTELTTELDEIGTILADTNELQTDLANGGRVDLLIDGIKAKTDPLTFTVANELDVNAQSINGVAITGDGAGTPWNAA
jgi:hypothetical protein